jgi:hypothetical protein
MTILVQRYLDGLYKLLPLKWAVIVLGTVIAQIGKLLNIRVVMQHAVTHAMDSSEPGLVINLIKMTSRATNNPLSPPGI